MTDPLAGWVCRDVGSVKRQRDNVDESPPVDASVLVGVLDCQRRLLLVAQLDTHVLPQYAEELRLRHETGSQSIVVEEEERRTHPSSDGRRPDVMFQLLHVNSNHPYHCVSSLY